MIGFYEFINLLIIITLKFNYDNLLYHKIWEVFNFTKLYKIKKITNPSILWKIFKF